MISNQWKKNLGTRTSFVIKKVVNTHQTRCLEPNAVYDSWLHNMIYTLESSINTHRTKSKRYAIHQNWAKRLMDDYHNGVCGPHMNGKMQLEKYHVQVTIGRWWKFIVIIWSKRVPNIKYSAILITYLLQNYTPLPPHGHFLPRVSI